MISPASRELHPSALGRHACSAARSVVPRSVLASCAHPRLVLQKRGITSSMLAGIPPPPPLLPTLTNVSHLRTVMYGLSGMQKIDFRRPIEYSWYSFAKAISLEMPETSDVVPLFHHAVGCSDELCASSCALRWPGSHGPQPLSDDGARRCVRTAKAPRFRRVSSQELAL